MKLIEQEVSCGIGGQGRVCLCSSLWRTESSTMHVVVVLKGA